MLIRILLGMFLCTAVCAQTQTATPPPALRAATLDDLFSELSTVDTAVSPSGRYVAAILRREKDDLLILVDVQTRERKVLRRVPFDTYGHRMEMFLTAVYWKSDERILFRVAIRPLVRVGSLSPTMMAKLGNRLVAINRDGTNQVALLGENTNLALDGAFDLGDIASFLPHDPAHILMVVDGFAGRSLFKVNLETGHGTQIEKPGENVIGWWLDLEGNPVVRMTLSSGTLSLYRKQENRWKKFQSLRLREMKERPEYDPIGPSDKPGKYYVLARPPGRERIGLYLYDLENESFGEPLIENPTFDLYSAAVSRDGTRVLRHCYLDHVRICEFAEDRINAHMKALRKFFDESANVYIYDNSEDARTFILYVEGPRDPPTYYYYSTEEKQVSPLGASREALVSVAMPRARVVEYTARDGVKLVGYLTLPPNAPADAKLPLVLYPHGGPETRDHLAYHPWVQFFAARGYAVFQPNFRGSSGLGKTFAESGYGEWGRKMQDDLGDGVKALVDQGIVDPARVCIVGASYGGYAALAGAALTPDAYKCAVSVAGVSDLEDFITWRRRNWGKDSEGYTYWLKAIGNPETDEARLKEVSPLHQVKRIKIPVLLIHGADDDVVPIAQSTAMKRALDKAGQPTQLIRLEDEGHSYWDNNSEKIALSNIDVFLWKHLGPGHGVTRAPVLYKKKD